MSPRCTACRSSVAVATYPNLQGIDVSYKLR